MAAVPHVIKPFVVDTTPPKRTFARILKEKKYYEYMPFGKYSKTATLHNNTSNPNNIRPYLKLEELPKSYIVWVIENVGDIDTRAPGLDDQLREILERKNNHTLPDNEENIY